MSISFCLECRRAFEQDDDRELDFCCDACSLRYSERHIEEMQQEMLESGEFNDL